MLKLVPTQSPPEVAATTAGEPLIDRYRTIRKHSLEQIGSLSVEDQCIQAPPPARSTKWHLAHTTWYFESLVLSKFVEGYRAFNDRFAFLFDPYYESWGGRVPGERRGLSRPSLQEVLDYRAHVDEALTELLRCDGQLLSRVSQATEVGLQHEQEHQEQVLADVLYAFWHNPLLPSAGIRLDERGPIPAPGWVKIDACDAYVGHAGSGYALDNEGPPHLVQLSPYAISKRLVTNSEYEEFIADDGYTTPSLWMQEGWAIVRSNAWQAPLYWMEEGCEFTLQGVRDRHPARPVTHLSFYEAAAFATWAGARLPTEFEWEVAVDGSAGPSQAFGAAWQWTRSAYAPYPKHRAVAGMQREHGGGFPIGHLVIRGSSVATSADRGRPTYRGFLPPGARWQFSGVRLVRDL